MSTLSQLIYTITSMEMSKDNKHLTNFRSDLRQIAAALRAGQAMAEDLDDEYYSKQAWDAALEEDV